MLRFTLKFNTIISLLFLSVFLALSSNANDLKNSEIPQSEQIIAEAKTEQNSPEITPEEATVPDEALPNNDTVLSQKPKGYVKALQAFDKSINILVSSSLTNAMQKIIQKYSVKRNISVNAVFDSPSELELTIESGEAADVFISEAPSLQDMQQKGLIDGFNIHNLYKDTLVIVAPKDYPLLAKIAGVTDALTVLQIIASNDLPVIADPDSDPAGYFTKEALVKYGLWAEISKKVFRAANTRVALYLISKGSKAGIVYKSDALADSNVQILAEIPDDHHSPIIYKGAVIAGENMSEARQFLSYLQSDEAAKIFVEHGLKEDE